MLSVETAQCAKDFTFFFSLVALLCLFVACPLSPVWKIHTGSAHSALKLKFSVICQTNTIALTKHLHQQYTRSIGNVVYFCSTAALFLWLFFSSSPLLSPMLLLLLMLPRFFCLLLSFTFYSRCCCCCCSMKNYAMHSRNVFVYIFSVFFYIGLFIGFIICLVSIVKCAHIAFAFLTRQLFPLYLCQLSFAWPANRDSIM